MIRKTIDGIVRQFEREGKLKKRDGFVKIYVTELSQIPDYRNPKEHFEAVYKKYESIFTYFNQGVPFPIEYAGIKDQSLEAVTKIFFVTRGITKRTKMKDVVNFLRRHNLMHNMTEYSIKKMLHYQGKPNKNSYFRDFEKENVFWQKSFEDVLAAFPYFKGIDWIDYLDKTLESK